MGRTGQHDGHEGEEGTEKRKRIDLSLSQVVGAGAATLAAATAASYLNVYGTIIGAAVMATLSTIVSPLLQHWFSRSGEQARQLAGKTVRHPEVSVTPAAGADIDTGALPGAGGTGTRGTGIGRTGAPPGTRGTGGLPGFSDDTDATRTMAMPVVGGSDGRTVVDGYTNPDDPATVDGYGDPAVVGGLGDPTVPTQAYGAATRTPASDGDAAPGVPEGTGRKAGPVRLGRRTVAVSAVVVFVLAMMVILLFEVLTGRSLTAWTQGDDDSTAPTLFGGSTSAPPAHEDGTGTPDAPEDTLQDTPDTFGQQPETGAPETGGPTDPGTGTEAPEDEGTGSDDGTGGTGGTGDTTAPTDPPTEGGDPQEPDPGTGGQGGQEGEDTAPEPAPVG